MTEAGERGEAARQVKEGVGFRQAKMASWRRVGVGGLRQVASRAGSGH